ncbi:MAG: transposase [Phycisphaerales bacterium]
MDRPKQLRKRMKRRDVPDGVRFITFSCHRRLPLLSNPRIATLLVDTLAASVESHGLEVVAWVAMPEHVHLLARPGPTSTLGAALRSIKMSVAKRVIARWRELDAVILTRTLVGGRPRFWQEGGGFDRNVRDEEELSREICYIHMNPVDRGLVKTPWEWQWSSVRWWMGKREGELPCTYPRGRGWETWPGFVRNQIP